MLLGSPTALLIPQLGRSRLGSDRLRGLALLHTHLTPDGLSQEDLMDLLFLRLDYLAVLTADKKGAPACFQYARLMPGLECEEPYFVSELLPWDREETDLAEEVRAIEEEIGRSAAHVGAGVNGPTGLGSRAKEPGGRAKALRATPEPLVQPRAVLISVSKAAKNVQDRHLSELAELAKSAGVDVRACLTQRPQEEKGRVILGEGKLAELEVTALQHRAGMIIFDGELGPAQIDNLAKVTERKVLDRTMLILDIFAQRAASRAGKLQVEMAQLQYALPRLAGRNTGRAMDRLSGGIGGRGPGETKLETDRRKIRERIARIKSELEEISRQRSLSRNRREKASLPMVCLVGYTNAGKSTLLNALTRSSVYAENQLFATLDPVARRLFVPLPDTEAAEPPDLPVNLPDKADLPQPDFKAPAVFEQVILTDTVGFIRDLPQSLREAFKATLEELDSASLLVHVADCAHPDLDMQVESVQTILRELKLDNIPVLLVLNKWDFFTAATEGRKTEFKNDLGIKLTEGSEEAENFVFEESSVLRMLDILKRYPEAVPVSAVKGQGLDFLVQEIGRQVRQTSHKAGAG